VTVSDGRCLIVGLGNPVPEYTGTRHNVGADAVRSLVRRLGLTMSSRRFSGESARSVLPGRPAVFLCPVTYMNLSGQSVQACADYYKIPLNAILVVHDDLDLPLGKLKGATGGGTGGHKGVASVIRHLGSGEFCRLKIGIGRPRFGEPVDRYVLSRFYPDEAEAVERVLQAAGEACGRFATEGIDRLMNEINRRQIHKTEVQS
jgi:peptidyl-tRNA hydrolase, PTH1 family